MNKTLICALAATVLAGVGFAGDARKGLKFWWRAEKKTAIGAPLEAGEFQEHMTWSKSAAPSQPYRINQTTQHDTYPVEPMCVTNVPVHFATARRTVDQDCLYFAEPMFDMENGGKAIDRQSVFLPTETSMLGKEGTLFVRFMWLGRHFSERTVVNFIGMGASWGTSGWAIGFGGYGTKDGAYVRFRNYKTTNDTYENSTSGLVNAGE